MNSYWQARRTFFPGIVREVFAEEVGFELNINELGRLVVRSERLHFDFSLSCIGEGNGNPLQCSCLEKPRDGGAWWAAVYGVTQSWTRLKWLSSSNSGPQCILKKYKNKERKKRNICAELYSQSGDLLGKFFFFFFLKFHMWLSKVISVENYWVCQAERRQKSFWMEEAALTKEETQSFYPGRTGKKKCRLLFCMY